MSVNIEMNNLAVAVMLMGVLWYVIHMERRINRLLRLVDRLATKDGRKADDANGGASHS